MERRRTPEVVGGRVNGDGSINAGDGFSISKTGTGSYNIIFGPGFKLVSLVAANMTASNRWVVTSAYTDRSVQVTVLNSAAAVVDDAFSFIAMGVQQ